MSTKSFQLAGVSHEVVRNCMVKRSIPLQMKYWDPRQIQNFKQQQCQAKKAAIMQYIAYSEHLNGANDE